ncbi:hypothetical protein UlMin_010836 [Ulmus minor]
MATNTLPSIPHHHSLLNHSPPPSPSLFLKPTAAAVPAAIPLSSTITFSLSSNATTSSSSFATSTSQTNNNDTVTLNLLEDHLAASNFRQADEVTRRLLIVLAGEAAQKRGYVFFSEVQFIPETDLKAIDELWRKYSDGKFGYSVQKRICSKLNMDFTKFFIKVGWMKKLDTEIEQFNYRAFPNEFIWELNDDTPEGHLPLTNALRGTQLLNSLLNHPAFEESEEEEETEEEVDGIGGLMKGLREGTKPRSGRVFKPDYSF